MKKTWIRIIAFVLLICLLPALLLTVGASLPILYGNSYYAELAPLTERLDQSEVKKLVLIGGSNIAFGVDVDLLEQLLAEKGYSYTVCPYGLYAAVGCSAMLSLSENALKEGDLVVLAVEPTDETMSAYFGASAFLKCAEDAPWLLARLNAEQRSAALGNYVSYLQERLSILRSGQLPEAEGVYSRNAFGDNGNLDYPREGNIMALGFDTAEPIDLKNVRIEEAFAEQVRDYCRAADRRGAQVWLSFSPVNRSALADESEDALLAFFTHCRESFSCPVISDPRRYVLDSAWFYDSNFHLNSAGAQIRTVLLAEDILAQLGCCEAVDYPLPTIPASAYQASETAGDAADFLLEPFAAGAGWQVTGLRPEAKEKSELALPASFEGKPVVGFTAGAFAGADQLEELRLPGSIETIPDNAFVGCPSLKRLVLLHENAPCGVSEHSFAGEETLRVYVPAAAYPMYRDGFGCEANPWTVFLDRVYPY